MKNKRFVIAGIIVILAIGMFSVFATQDSWFGHKGWKKCGTCSYKNLEGCPYKDFGDKSAWLEKMGLSPDATDAEIIAAKKSLWTQDKADYMTGIREKLGLSPDASEEEVNEAMQQWKSGFHSKKKSFGFHKGCSKS